MIEHGYLHEILGNQNFQIDGVVWLTKFNLKNGSHIKEGEYIMKTKR